MQACGVELVAHAVDKGLVSLHGGGDEQLLLVVLLCVASSPHRAVRDAALRLAKVCFGVHLVYWHVLVYMLLQLCIMCVVCRG